jgi:long-chain fatty acid transport protein
VARARLAALSVVAVLCIHGSAGAAGILVNEVSARGTAAQGALSARPDDASTIYFNPAGLTALSGTQVEINPTVLLPAVDYERPGVGSSENTRTIAGVSMFVATDAVDSVSLGLGIYAPFARSARFDRNVATLSQSHLSGLVRTDVVPTFAFRPTKRVSVGLGIVASQVQFRSDVLGLKESGRGYGFTANAGVLVDAPGGLTVGLTYRGAMSARVEGRGSFGGQRGDFHAKLRFPATVSVGVVWDATPQLTLGVAYDRELWSYVDRFRRDYDDPTLAAVGTTTFDARDASTIRLGLAYRPSEGHELRLGVSRIGSAFPARNTTPVSPDFDVVGAAVGYTRRFERFSVSITYEYLRSEERKTPTTFFPGRYEARANVLQLGFAYRFETD